MSLPCATLGDVPSWAVHSDARWRLCICRLAGEVRAAVGECVTNQGCKGGRSSLALIGHQRSINAELSQGGSRVITWFFVLYRTKTVIPLLKTKIPVIQISYYFQWILHVFLPSVPLYLLTMNYHNLIPLYSSLGWWNTFEELMRFVLDVAMYSFYRSSYVTVLTCVLSWN